MAKEKDIRVAISLLLEVGHGLQALHAIAEQAEQCAPIDAEVLRQACTHMTANFMRDLTLAYKALGEDVVIFEPRSS